MIFRHFELAYNETITLNLFKYSVLHDFVSPVYYCASKIQTLNCHYFYLFFIPNMFCSVYNMLFCHTYEYLRVISIICINVLLAIVLS